MTSIPFFLVRGPVDGDRDLVQLFREGTQEEECLLLKKLPVSLSLHFPGTLGSLSPSEPALTCSGARGPCPPFTTTDPLTATQPPTHAPAASFSHAPPTTCQSNTPLRPRSPPTHHLPPTGSTCPSIPARANTARASSTSGLWGSPNEAGPHPWHATPTRAQKPLCGGTERALQGVGGLGAGTGSPPAAGAPPSLSGDRGLWSGPMALATE